MHVEAKNGKQICISRFELTEVAELSQYLQDLGPETRLRFGPHPYDVDSISGLYLSSDCYMGFISREVQSGQIIAYAIVKIGYLEHDRVRLESYGLVLNGLTDCTFAPSVSDAWQGQGVGNRMLDLVISELKRIHVKRIVLWGGVQATNEGAMAYYLKRGFKVLGAFEYYGNNYDMICEMD